MAPLLLVCLHPTGTQAMQGPLRDLPQSAVLRGKWAGHKVTADDRKDTPGDGEGLAGEATCMKSVVLLPLWWVGGTIILFLEIRGDYAGT